MDDDRMADDLDRLEEQRRARLRELVDEDGNPLYDFEDGDE